MSVINVQFGNPSPRVQQLRELLSEKFPAAAVKNAGALQVGWEPLDQAGGLRRGAVTELTGPVASGGLFIELMLGLLQREKYFAALVDATRGFDPRDCSPGGLQRLLWVMCSDVKQSVQVTDLLLRDANLPVVLLDLQMAAPRQLRGIPSSTWHRFRRLAEPTTTALVILTRRPMVEAAQVRIATGSSWTLEAMRQRRSALVSRLGGRVFDRRHFSELPDLQQQLA